jgi:hypothetical protein
MASSDLVTTYILKETVFYCCRVGSSKRKVKGVWKRDYKWDPYTTGILRSQISLLRFQVLTAASMKFRIVFWDVLPCKIIVDRRFRGTCCLHHQRWVIPDDWGSTYLWNVGWQLFYTAVHPRRQFWTDFPSLTRDGNCMAQLHRDWKGIKYSSSFGQNTGQERIYTTCKSNIT